MSSTKMCEDYLDLNRFKSGLADDLADKIINLES